jgi:hypothetical protein
VKKNLLLFCFLFVASVLYGQAVKTENVVVITMDGLRWQEVFGGADSVLTFAEKPSYSTSFVKRHFWAASAIERRKKAMPFLWSVVAEKGVILGNRAYGNYVNTANPYWFSYPGYNEIFTGYPDKDVNSNDKIPNKNENVFEYLNKLPEFKGRTAAFGSWGVFASIFNEQRSGFLVNDGFRDVPGKLTERQVMFNKMQHEMPDLFHGGERLDVATFNIAFEYMKVNKPRLIHFGFGDSDEFAHAGQYDLYLDAIQNSDDWIRQIWNYIQSTPFYANKTTLIITTDHGRGAAEGGAWRHHGSDVPGASEIWIAAIGPAVKSVGEAKNEVQYQQGQVAATVAKILGKEFKTNHPVLPALSLDGK